MNDNISLTCEMVDVIKFIPDITGVAKYASFTFNFHIRKKLVKIVSKYGTNAAEVHFSFDRFNEMIKYLYEKRVIDKEWFKKIINE